MYITSVQPKLYSGSVIKTQNKNNKESIGCQNFEMPVITAKYTTENIRGNYASRVNFGEYFDPNRTVPHIDYEEYMDMKPSTKRRMRLRYESFPKGIKTEELFDKESMYLPLKSEALMDEFIKTSKIYSKYKDQHIICLGRSPKWFLNAALWMKDGIDDYNFVAFSSYWYRPNYEEGMKRIDHAAPTEKEEIAYRKYLRRKEADPQSIVRRMQETGKKTVITDYICSSKGVCSFLDIMSKEAEELGILEDFSKSIQIVGIGSMDYMEELNPYADTISEPRVIMPERLRPYDRNIKQEFYNMDYMMFREMLLNQNTNECRSTYYPHQMWTRYKPDRLKTGIIRDFAQVKKMVAEANGPKKVLSHFTPAMFDYRNLLNFRILDGLNSRGLLKAVHKSKI